MKILKTDIEEFTHIVHLADIQVRLTTRHDEYQLVFQDLYSKIKNTPPTTAICILGDVVHSKVDLSPECVQMTKDFLGSLADIRPTILVAGNHDANLTNRNRLDSLSPIVDAIKHPNLHYLRKSGLYSLGDIVFNNYSIFDPNDVYIKGSDIPSIYRNQFRYFVSLFHGPVNNALSDLGYQIINKANSVEMFDHHDIALLGDIHKMQDLQYYDDVEHKAAVHYCGSLIQQNHGENIENHGISLWSLKEKTHQHIEIPNEFGYFTISVNKGILETDLSGIPKKARLRIKCFESVQSEIKSVLADVKKVSDLTEVSYFVDEDPNSSAQSSTGMLPVVLNNLTDPTYQDKLLTEYLKEKLQIIDQSVIDSVLKVNKLIYSQIDKDDFARNIKWKPKRFEWENLFSYGEDNYIDFTKLNDIFGLFAPNRSGKSSLFSALTYCIFDKCEREFKASTILNDQKMGFYCKFNFDIDGVDFFIERRGTADKKRNVKVDVKFWKVENGVKTELNGDDRYNTNDVIRDYLGTYEDFVLTALSVQYGKNVSSFIDMGHAERKDLLSQFIGLAMYDKLHTKSSDKFKELSAVLKEYKNFDFIGQITANTNGLAQAESVFNDENRQIEFLSKLEEKARYLVLEETKKLIKIEGSVPSLETSEAKKKNNSDSLARSTLESEDYKKSSSDILNIFTSVENDIKKLEEQDVSNAYKEYQILILQLNSTQAKMDKKKIEVAHKLEKVNKSKQYKYDPNCKSCVENAGVVVSEGIDAEKALAKDMEQSVVLKSEYTQTKEKLSKCEPVAKLYDSYTKLLDRRNKIRNNLDSLTEKMRSLVKDAERFQEGIKKEEENIQLYLKNKDSIEWNKKIAGQIESYNQEMAKITFQLKIKNKTILELNGKISVFKNQIESIKTKEQYVKNIEEEYKVYELYIKAVSRDGIPYEIISRTLPEIEREVNSILDQTSDFHAHFETDGKNIIPYIVEDSRKWMMTGASGYEKFMLSLAIRVALINISNLPKPNFLVIDEGFGVIDSNNFPSMSVLFSYLKTNFDFILIISHLDSLRDVVDKHIEIKKDNGFSKINFE